MDDGDAARRRDALAERDNRVVILVVCCLERQGRDAEEPVGGERELVTLARLQRKELGGLLE